MNQPPIITLDTNVLVSGLLNPFGKPGRIVDLLLDRQIRIALDDRILLEYRQVLRRPKFGFPRVSVDRLLAIASYQERITPQPWPHPPSPDPHDTVFLEVAAASSGLLITGNLRHFPKSCRGPVRVLDPHTWLAQGEG
mgnify:CR=1 FL=1